MKVSICMATYNGGEYIREQIDSILHQVFRENKDFEMEIVVSDDASTDDTINILRSYNDFRIKIFYNHSPKKQYKYLNASRACMRNFENAIRHSTGDYIFLCDQDDVWYPNKIDKQLSALIHMGGDKCGSF